ncbi:MAG: hypothetical protein HYW48_02915 [Deltaproteobacteria bacterium]|nr:hypothetical protein [Deltaproteobacteria bacterium]
MKIFPSIFRKKAPSFVLVLWFYLCSGMEPNTLAQTNGLLLGYSRNFPVADAKRRYSPSILHPTVGIRYISQDWVLGFTGHFKFFTDNWEESKLSMWTFEQEFYYKMRIYHPFYFLLGGKLLYIFPTTRGMFPLRKREEHFIEVGIAATASFLYELSNTLALGIYLDRWRGTRTKRLQGLECGIQIIIPFDWF